MKHITKIVFTLLLIISIGFNFGQIVKADNITKNYQDIVILKKIKSYLNHNEYKTQTFSTTNKNIYSKKFLNKDMSIQCDIEISKSKNIQKDSKKTYNAVNKLSSEDFKVVSVEKKKTKEYKYRFIEREYIKKDKEKIVSGIKESSRVTTFVVELPNDYLLTMIGYDFDHKDTNRLIREQRKDISNLSKLCNVTENDTNALIKEALRSKLFISIVIIFMLIMIFYLIIRAKIFKKAGYKGWYTLIPLYSDYILSKIAFNNGWVFIIKYLSFIPGIGTLIFVVYLGLEGYFLCKAFGKDKKYQIAMILGLLFFGILYIALFVKIAFDSSKYVGIHNENKKNNNYN